MKMPLGRKILFYCMTFFIIFVVFFAIGEVCFRIFRGPPNPLSTSMQRYRQYLFDPNSTQPQKSNIGEYDTIAHINDFGYRGKNFNSVKGANQKRIFVIGDSFTFGVGAEDHETIPFFIEQKLLKNHPDIEVINAGVGNTSPLTHYVNLKNIHMQYQPDLVLLLLDMSDLQDDWHSHRHAVRDKEGEIIGFDLTMYYGKRNWWLWSTRYSAFCKYMHKKLVRMIWKINAMGLKEYSRAIKERKKAKALIANSRNVTNDETIMEYDFLVWARGDYRKNVIDKHFSRTKKYILKIHELLKQNDIPMVIVMYPYGIQVAGNQWAEGRTYWGFEKGKLYDHTYPFELVGQLAKENKIPFISTLDALRSADLTKKYYFDHDGHLNPAGSKIVADAVCQSNEFKKVLQQLY